MFLTLSLGSVRELTFNYIPESRYGVPLYV